MQIACVIYYNITECFVTFGVVFNMEINGLIINVRISGEGDDTVMILQGWGTELSVYDSLADILKIRYRVVQFDLPGFGRSDEPDEPWNVDGYADFFCELVKKLDIKKTDLIGHSYGGRIIIKLASRESLPFTIGRIVLIDSAGILPVRTFAQKMKIRQYKVIKKLFDTKIFYALFPELVDDWKSRQGSADYRNATPVMRQCLVKAVNEDLTELLPRIRQDTLLIWGDRDTATPVRDARIMEEKIPNAGLIIFEGAGHYSFLDKPQEFKSILRSFFRIGDAS